VGVPQIDNAGLLVGAWDFSLDCDGESLDRAITKEQANKVSDVAQPAFGYLCSLQIYESSPESGESVASAEV
jgi:hypothetical protein